MQKLCKRGSNMHTHGFDNVDPIEYAINKRNLYVSDVLMKHQLSTQMSNNGETTNNTNTTTNTTTTTTTSPTHAVTTSHPMIKNNNDSAIDFNSNVSLTSLLHQQQEEHDRKQQQEAISISNSNNEHVFQSD